MTIGDWLDEISVKFDELGFVPTTLTDEKSEHFVEWFATEISEIKKEEERLKAELKARLERARLYRLSAWWKHRAEVAERAGKIIQRDMARVFDVSNPNIRELIANIWDLSKKQAEKELQEERKDD